MASVYLKLTRFDKILIRASEAPLLPSRKPMNVSLKGYDSGNFPGLFFGPLERWKEYLDLLFHFFIMGFESPLVRLSFVWI